MHLKLVSHLNDITTEITNPTIKPKQSLEDSALFSQVIFGPVKNYTCKCYVNNKHLIGQRCPKCGVLIGSSSLRRYTQSKIKLPFKIIHPVIFDRIAGNRKMKLRSLIYNLLNGNGYNIVDNKLVEEPNPTKAEFIFLKNFSKLMTFLYEANPNNMVLSAIYKNLDNLLIDEILVIPPDMRPIFDERIIDDLNDFYSTIIEYVRRIKQSPLYDDNNFQTYNINEDFPMDIYKKYLGLVQYQVGQLYNYIISKLKGKRGILRSNMLGKRVDFSGRSVIIVDPNIKLGYAGIPYLMLLELFKLQLANKLVEDKIEISIQSAITNIELAIVNKDLKYWDFLDEIIQDEWVELNRQPSLHRMNIMAFKIQMIEGYAITISPLVCPPYNGDFDGDSTFCEIKLDIILKSKKNSINRHQIITSQITELQNLEIEI